MACGVCGGLCHSPFLTEEWIIFVFLINYKVCLKNNEEDWAHHPGVDGLRSPASALPHQELRKGSFFMGMHVPGSPLGGWRCG